MVTVAILHPGEMGAAVGRALADVGVDVCWLAEGRSTATRRRAEAAGLRPLGSTEDLSAVDVVVSLCPPGAALDVAAQVAGFAGTYLDANAVSPATAAEVAALVTSRGASYVDGGVIGPPPNEPGTTRLYLSGDDAPAVADLFVGSRLEARVLDAGGFAASALKMAYASWTKISAALLLAARESAAANGVEPDLLAEWAISQPHLADRWAAAERSASSKGWRWDAEMTQIARTFEAVGQPPGFGEAAAEVFRRYPRPPTD